MQPLRKLIRLQHRRDFSPAVFLLVCIFVGIFRATEESLLFAQPLRNSEILSYITFYFSLGILLAGLLRHVAGLSAPRTFVAVQLGLFLGLFPPLIDTLLGATRAFYGYYYLWNLRELPWLGYKPSFNFPPGETVTIWLSISFCAVYARLQGTGLVRTLAVFLGAYLIFLWQGSLLPILVARVSLGEISDLAQISQVDRGQIRQMLFHLSAAQCAAVFLPLVMTPAPAALRLLRRLPHFLPFLIVFLAGAFAPGRPGTELLPGLIVIGMVILTASVQNDVFDAEPGNPGEKRLTLINLSLLLTLSMFFVIGSRFVWPALLAFVTSVLYHYPFYRGKAVFPANLKMEGVWGAACFLTGLSLYNPLELRPRHFFSALLVLGGFSLLAALKEMKDMTADAKNGNKTFYIWLRHRGADLHFWHRILLFACWAAMMVIPVFLIVKGKELPGAISAAAFSGIYFVLTRRFLTAKRFRLLLLLVGATLCSWLFFLPGRL